MAKEIIENLNLDEALAQKNCIVRGKMNLMKKADGSSVFIPVTVVCGAEDGPTFLVDACIHGEEYEGCEAILHFLRKVDPSVLRGKMICVPVLNLEGFMTGTRGAIHDYYGFNDLNRSFPGRDDGFFTQYLAKFYKDNIMEKADYYLSFHGGGNYLYLQPESGAHVYPDEIGEKSMAMAKAFGANAIWRNVPGTFNGTGTSRELAHDMGIPSCLAEIGGQSTRFGFRTENVARLEKGIWNIMKHLDMLPGDPELAEVCYVAEVEYLHCHNGGLHYLQQEPLTPIKKGEVLSVIRDIFDNEVEVIRAPYDGMIIGYWAYSLIQPHQHAYLYGKVVETMTK